VADPKKIAVGGHSYGAFMAANLLAHAPHLFCCGIARSGAYNRTLTPFGFQVLTIMAFFILPVPIIVFSFVLRFFLICFHTLLLNCMLPRECILE